MRVANVPMQGWLATPTRWNALKGFLIAPSFIMLGIATQSNPSYVDYDSMISNQEIENRITNYVQVVGETERVYSSGPGDEERIRAVAELWADQAKEGKLKALPPQGTHDNFMQGVKGQILGSVRLLSNSLSKFAEKAAERKEFDRAARDLGLGLQVLQPVRYSDVTTLAVVSGRQRQMLKKLTVYWPNVSAPVRAELRPIIEKCKGTPDDLKRVIQQEHQVAVIEYGSATEMAISSGKVPAAPAQFTDAAAALGESAVRTEDSNRLAASLLL